MNNEKEIFEDRASCGAAARTIAARRLPAGSHKVFFGLPEDDYYREVVINVKGGEAQTLEFKPEYRYKRLPTRIPTYMQGVSRYDILINGSPVAQ